MRKRQQQKEPSGSPVISDLLGRAIGWLGPKARTVFEMRRYLSERFPEASPILVDEAITHLERRKYLDDSAYASAFIDEARRLHPMGKNLIQLRLQERGINPDIVDAALEALSREDELAMAETVADKHRRIHGVRAARGSSETGEELRKNQARLMRALDGRGFSEDIARAVVFGQSIEQE